MLVIRVCMICCFMIMFRLVFGILILFVIVVRSMGCGGCVGSVVCVWIMIFVCSVICIISMSLFMFLIVMRWFIYVLLC